MSELMLTVTKTLECDVLVLGGTATAGMVGPFMTSLNPASTIEVTPKS